MLRIELGIFTDVRGENANAYGGITVTELGISTEVSKVLLKAS